MAVATALSSSSAAARSGRLVVLLAAAAFLVAGWTGNSFSLHVGMTTSDSAVAAAVPGAVAGDIPEGAGAAATDASSPMPKSPEGQHLMHLLGACLAVVAAAVALLLGRVLHRSPGAGYAPDTALLRTISPVGPAVWSPPPLSPPTSSPVIRT